MRAILTDFDVKLDGPTRIFEDNQGAIPWSKDGIRQAKHVGIRFNFVKVEVKGDTVDLEYCPTASMVADVLAEPLLRVKFEGHLRGLRVFPNEIEDSSKKRC